ncbi:MAG TPA: DciA family protein [Pseudonocardiaceae bacterium]
MDTVDKSMLGQSSLQRAAQRSLRVVGPLGHPGEQPADGAAEGTTPPDPPRGVDIARAALDSARAAARSSGPQSGAPRRSGSQRAPTSRRRRWSGSRPDDRDPQTLGRLAARLVADRGWANQVSAGVVLGRWEQLVGREVAEHAQPVSLRDGELIVAASSTAWATQLRLLQRQLIGRIAAGVGSGVVTKLRVQGPAKPSWHYGPRHVRGRGPRDTYG